MEALQVHGHTVVDCYLAVCRVVVKPELEQLARYERFVQEQAQLAERDFADAWMDKRVPWRGVRFGDLGLGDDRYDVQAARTAWRIFKVHCVIASMSNEEPWIYDHLCSLFVKGESYNFNPPTRDRENKARAAIDSIRKQIRQRIRYADDFPEEIHVEMA